MDNTEPEKINLILDEICKMDIPTDDINVNGMIEITRKLLPLFVYGEGKIKDCREQAELEVFLVRCHIIALISLRLDVIQNPDMSIANEVNTAIAVLAARLNYLLKEIQKKYRDTRFT
jgi:hypothetical protein